MSVSVGNRTRNQTGLSDTVISGPDANPCGRDVIAITGGAGFIGRHLLFELSQRPDIQVRCLSRSPRSIVTNASNFINIQGDLTELESLENFLVPGCVVINLAYSFKETSEKNLSAARNLAEICRKFKISKLIHCSTASVYGSSTEIRIDENSRCNPTLEYGRTKLEIERILLEGSKGSFEFINLRPTSVFGPGGLTLMKMIVDIQEGNALVNYARSCLFGARKLNLVGVKTVVRAIVFFLDHHGFDGETYNVAEDDADIDINNYKSVEKLLRSKFSHSSIFVPRIPVPSVLLVWLLTLRGREVINPHRTYSAEKICKAGFVPPANFLDSLNAFIDWYISERSMLTSDAT